MAKELLQYLFDTEYEKFKTHFESFFLKYTSNHDQAKYSFMPAFLDGWLTNSAQLFDFDLYKFYQSGKFSFDSPSYVLIPKNINKAYILTLNNILQRDTETQTEIVNKKKESLAPREKSTVRYENEKETYIQLLKAKIRSTSADNITMLLAKNALLFSYDDSKYTALANLLHNKLITRLGVANDGKRALFLEISDDRTPASFLKTNDFHSAISKLKTAMQLQTPIISHIKLEAQANLGSSLSQFLTDDALQKDLAYTASFQEQLKNLLTLTQTTTNGAKLDEAYLHGLLIGGFLSYRRNSDITIKSNHESGNGRFDIVIIPKQENQHTALLFELKKSNRLDHLNAAVDDALKQIANQSYLDGLGKYENINHVRSFGIAYFKHNILVKPKTRITLVKKTEHQFSRLIAENNIEILKHNLNLFSQAVISQHDINSRNPDFLPGFFLGLMLEGVENNHIISYSASQQNFQEFTFLISSKLSDQLILITHISPNDPQLLTKLGIYKAKLNEIQQLKPVLTQISLLHIVHKPNNKEISLILNTKTLSSFITSLPQKVHAEIFLLEKIQKNFSLLVNHLTQGDISLAHKTEIAHFAEQFRSIAQRIFSSQVKNEAFYHGGILGLLADDWKQFHLESNFETGKGRADIRIIPSQIPPIVRKRSKKNAQRALIFEFKKAHDNKLLTNIAENALEQINIGNYADSISELSPIKSANFIAIAWSDESSTVAFQNNHAIFHSSSEADSPLKKPRQSEPLQACNTRQKRSTNPKAGCINIASNENFPSIEDLKRASDDIAALSGDELQLLDQAKKEIFNTFQEQGVDPKTLHGFEILIEKLAPEVSNQLVNTLNSELSKQNKALSTQQLRSSKTKLSRWFSVSLWYNTMDNSIALRQSGSLGTLFVSNDLFESFSGFLGARLSGYQTTRSMGRLLHKLATNPLTKTIGNLAVLVQFASSTHQIAIGQGTGENYYWSVRGLHQLLSLFSKGLARMNPPLFFLDVLLSIGSQARSSEIKLQDYTRTMELSTSQQWDIRLRHFFAMDLSRYDLAQTTKIRLDTLYENLKQLLIGSSHLKAVVLYPHTPVKSIQYKVETKTTHEIIGGASHLHCIEQSQPNFYNLLLSSENIDENIETQNNLKNISTTQTIAMREIYLGSLSNTNYCLRHYTAECTMEKRRHGRPKSKLAKMIETYHTGYNQETFINSYCQLKDGSSPQGNECYKKQQIEKDKLARTVKAIASDDIDPSIMPTMSLSDSKRYAWLDFPRGQLQAIKESCRALNPIKKPNSLCNNEAISKQCDEYFYFSARPAKPFILTEIQRPIHNPILYLNAGKQNNTFLLKVSDANPAIVHVRGDVVNYEGSTYHATLFMLHGSPQGTIAAGNTNKDVLDSIYLNSEGQITTDFANNQLSYSKNGQHQILSFSSIEEYKGHPEALDAVITQCSTRSVDGRGNKPNHLGDIISVNSEQNCANSDTESRIVYSHDLHYLAPNKPITFHAKHINSAPAYLINADTTQSQNFNHLVLLDIPLDKLKIIKLQHEPPLPEDKTGYSVGINKKTFFISNGYGNLIYQTSDGYQFFIFEKTLADYKSDINNQILYKKQRKNNSTLLNNLLIHSFHPLAHNLQIHLRYQIKENKTREYFQEAIKKIYQTNLPISRLEIIDEIRTEITVIGSPAEDIFLAEQAAYTYSFEGGEGNDYYKLFPSNTPSPSVDTIIINNYAELLAENHGEDILDLSAFEGFLSEQEIKLQYPKQQEITQYKLPLSTIVISIPYYNTPAYHINELRVFLTAYQSGEEYKHLQFKWDTSNYLYVLDFSSNHFVRNNFSNLETFLTNTTEETIPLNHDFSIQFLSEINTTGHYIHRTKRAAEAMSMVDFNQEKTVTSGASHHSLGIYAIFPKLYHILTTTFTNIKKEETALVAYSTKKNYFNSNDCFQASSSLGKLGLCQNKHELMVWWPSNKTNTIDWYTAWDHSVPASASIQQVFLLEMAKSNASLHLQWNNHQQLINFEEIAHTDLCHIFPHLPQTIKLQFLKEYQHLSVVKLFNYLLAQRGLEYIAGSCLLHTRFGDFFRLFGLYPHWKYGDHNHFIARWLTTVRQLFLETTTGFRCFASVSAALLETAILYPKLQNSFKKVLQTDNTRLIIKINHLLADIFQFGLNLPAYLPSLIEYLFQDYTHTTLFTWTFRALLSLYAMGNDASSYYLGLALFIVPQLPFFLEHLGLPITHSLSKTLDYLSQTLIFKALMLEMIPEDTERLLTRKLELQRAEHRVDQGKERITTIAKFIKISPSFFFKTFDKKTNDEKKEHDDKNSNAQKIKINRI
ncbi:MAG: PD-(D/E)XK nuclease domain-containing protein [Rickettsiella sp.]|nr:PD-(D/E)XK nuclease domain-containing protein [Rickettsiella sp.]